MLYSQESIINGFTKHDTYFMEMVYKDVYPSVYNYIQQNSGDKHDAEDIFHDGLIMILNKINKNDFKLCCSFQTFVLSVCKNVWLNKLRRKGLINNDLPDDDVFSEEEYIKISKENTSLEEYKLFKKHFKTLGDQCRSILKSIIKGEKQKKIAVKMEFPSEGSFKKKLLKCKLELLKRIKSDRKFQELNNEN